MHLEINLDKKILIDPARKALSVCPLKILSQSSRALIVLCENPDSHEESEKILKISESSEFIGQEIRCLCQLRHPNIVSLERTWRNEKAHYMLLEKVPGRSVIEILVVERRLFELEAFKIASQIGSALEYLHKSGWIHRDVKPDNIIYDRRTGVAKLIDFEFSCKISDRKKLKERKGTLQYVAPEVRRGEVLKGPEVDIWSFGVSLFVMVCGFFPFNPDQLLPPPFQPLLPFSKETSTAFRTLVQRMLQNEPSKRIKIEEVNKDEWIKRETFFESILDWFQVQSKEFT